MSDYRTYVTQTGFGLERDAKFNNTQVDLAVLVVGDGVLPDSTSPAERTDLIHQVREYAITIEKDEKDPNVWIARAEIPASDGGFFIKEAGVKTTDGELYAYARQAGDYKPLLSEGQGKSYTIRLKFVPGNADAIQIKIDPSVQFATPKDLENLKKEHLENQNPHPQYETDEGASAKVNSALNSAKSYTDSQAVATLSAAKNYTDAENSIHGVPVGSIHYFPTLITPTGFLKMQGGEVSRIAYAALFTFAQSSGNMASSEANKQPGQFGPGDGTTTFTLPNPQGYFIRVWDESGLIDSGRGFSSIQNDELARHNHSRPYGGSAQAGDDNGGAPVGTGTGYGTGRREGPTGSTGGSETRPKNIAWPMYMKY